MKEELRSKARKPAKQYTAGQMRVDNAAAEIKQICELHNVAIVVSGFALVDGRLIPQIQVVPQ